MASPNPRSSIDSSTSPSSPLRTGEYPFPRYDAAQRPSPSGRYQPRRGSTASSITSIGGVLDTSSSSWSQSVIESGQNAISTLLQPPIVRTGLLPHTSLPASSMHRLPTAKDIPPVSLTNITHVDSSEFIPYLTQVGSLYDALQRAKDSEDDAGARLLRRGSRVDDFSDLLESSSKSSTRKTLSRQASLASLASLSPLETPQPRRRSSGGLGRRAAHAPTPLSTVPNVYFEDDFHLENPRTFDVVSERSEVIRPSPGSPDDRKNSNGGVIGPRKALATNAILQEKLSWYMDTIEIHLISSISTASSSFFAALGSLRELHSEAAESVARIKILREELDALDKEMAIGGLDIVNKKRRRENLKQLGDAIYQLRSVVEGVGRCESLVDGGDIEKALNAMDALENLIQGEQSDSDAALLQYNHTIQLRDLRQATALQGVNADLNTLRYRVGKSFEARFLNTLLNDLRSHIETVPNRDILQRWSNAAQRSRGSHHVREASSYPTYMTMNDELRSQLLATLKGLHRAHHTSVATTAFRDAVLKEVKTIIKRPLPSSNDDDTDSVMSASTIGGRQLSQQERSAILARNLRALDPVAAEEILAKIYIGVGETLRRLGTQVKVLLDVTTSLDTPSPVTRSKSPPQSPNIPSIDGRASGAVDASSGSSRGLQEELHQALDISNLLGQAVDIAQNQIVKVLRVRTEQSTREVPVRFLRYFTLNLLFANECEAVSGRSGTPLKNVVNSHIKDFVKYLGDSEQQKLAQGMDADPWNARDFTEGDSVHLARILECSDRDPEIWTVGSKIWLPYDEHAEESSKNGDATPATNGSSARDKVRQATIDSESFILPVSAILCLRGFEPFLQVITVIPSLTADVSASLLSYLQLFNSRCTQLILGAGATRSVGLKNITTKHLALASQALSFITTLIPHIREFIRRHAGSGASVSAVMGEFDKVKRLFQEHQNNISDKLVDIMSGRATLHVKSMKAIKWDNSSDISVNLYMETLVKETSTLHKVLSRHLPDSTVLMIMEPVFKSYKEQWGKAFADAAVETEEGRQRMLRDSEYFNNRLSRIDGAGDTGEHIIKVINDKKIRPPPAPEPEPTPAPAPVAASVGATTEDNGDTAVNGEKEKEKEDSKDTNEVNESKQEVSEPPPPTPVIEEDVEKEKGKGKETEAATEKKD